MNRIGKGIVTQQSVAEAAGVHASTVSLALRNDLRLLPETRQRIRAIADRLGYKPDPLISLLMARMRRGRVAYRGTLAFVQTVPASPRPRLGAVPRNFLAGATQRAEQLGYKLDEFYLSKDPRGGSTLTRILRARNVAGVVVHYTPSPACPDHTLPFDVTPFAVAAIGVPLVRPQVHYIANDQYMRPILAARELLALGYRRLGLVMLEPFDVHMAHRCSAGFWALQQYVAELAPVPILQLKSREDAPALRRWLRRNRPDAVLTPRSFVLNLIRQAGARVPEDLGFALIDWLPDFAPAAGVYGNSEHIGAAAVEVVVSQLHRGERGPPARATNHLIAGSWVPGKTVRRVGPPIDLNATFYAAISNV